jgi:phosphatidylglycerol:prolipoprotein diacylglycerol transferase
MRIPGPWVHDIDPIIGTVFGVHLWWYGLSYSLGFLNAHLFFMRRRHELGLSPRSVYHLSLLLAGGVLVGGRLLVVFYERTFYRDHLSLIPAVWLGGMATHGLILGGLAGVVLFSMVIASDATRDIPSRYGKRHPGLHHSRMYPPIPHPAGERE